MMAAPGCAAKGCDTLCVVRDADECGGGGGGGRGGGTGGASGIGSGCGRGMPCSI